MSEQKKDFTGVWIPRVIVEDDRLTWTDRACYAEISCYQKCFASNEFLAKRLGISESMVSKVVSKLKQLEYVEDAGFNGRFRLLIARQPSNVLLGSLATDCEADQQSIATIDNSIDNNKDFAVSNETENLTSETKDKLSGNTERVDNKEEGYTVVPTDPEGNQVAPRKSPNSWDKEKRVFAIFADLCQEHGLPEPEPAKLWQLKLIRGVIVNYDKNQVLEIFEDWLNDAPDDKILNIHAALSAHNLNKYKMKQ